MIWSDTGAGVGAGGEEGGEDAGEDVVGRDGIKEGHAGADFHGIDGTKNSFGSFVGVLKEGFSDFAEAMAKYWMSQVGLSLITALNPIIV